MSPQKPHILLMGQTPPPWHGQAVATQILFEHDWPGFEVHRLRMEFSEEMVEVGRFQWKKIARLFHLIREARNILREHPGCVLFYPPASAKWIPFLRDAVFLASVRHLAGATVFIYHASGLPVFSQKGPIRKLLSNFAYQNAEISLEVAQEAIPPHQVFDAKSWRWCPCAIEVPDRERPPRKQDGPLTVLFVGSLQEGKGVVEILKTASILKKRGYQGDIRFRLVGKWFSEDFEEGVRHSRAERELEEMVELTGELTGDAKWDAYFGADVFFFPTHYESEATPIVLMEALGAGLPLISTEWAGIPAMLDGCPTARLLPVRSPEAFADALIEMSANLEHADEMSRASRKFYQENFLPARFIERVENAFHTAVQMQGGACLMKAQDEEMADIGHLNSEDRNQKSALEDRPAAAGAWISRNEIPIGDISVSTAPLLSSAPMLTSDRTGAEHPAGSPQIRNLQSDVFISAYLADQNPGHDRSYGISRMTQTVLTALLKTGRVEMETISSRTSQQGPPDAHTNHVLPWGTRRKWMRLLTDHLHPLFLRPEAVGTVFYFPKGYLPWWHSFCRPSVVTIHDTIIQHDEDHYPAWRKPREYAYWARLLKHTLRHADHIMTVSQSSRRQIESFMARHGIPRNHITVTYEPCIHEQIPQPENPAKENYVIHLASCEPHKRSAHLIRWWHLAEQKGHHLPTLHLIGSVPPEVEPLLKSARTIVKRPFLDDPALQAAYLQARALILPSEIEGFGLPALEAYYLGTPVCFVLGTSVEEVLSVATDKGGFSLDSLDSLLSALDEVLRMSPEEVRSCGLKLRETYASEKVAARMLETFRSVAAG